MVLLAVRLVCINRGLNVAGLDVIWYFVDGEAFRILICSFESVETELSYSIYIDLVCSNNLLYQYFQILICMSAPLDRFPHRNI